MWKTTTTFYIQKIIKIFKTIENTSYKVYIIYMSGKDFVKKLMQDGWELDRVHGSHHIMRKNGSTLSVPVHKNEDLDKGIYSQLLKKAGYKK